MRWKLAALLACCLVLGACCSVCSDSSKSSPARPSYEHSCLAHPEPPFPLDDTTGPPLVLGTADFDSTGAVLIKIQVEDLAGYAGDEADITVWSGNGDAPADASVVPPPGGTQVYKSTGDVHLRHWTTHLDRNYDPDEDTYWLFVRVDHNPGDGSPRVIKYLAYEWPSGPTGELDEPRVFNQF